MNKKQNPIHIKESHRGLFTAKAKAAGMSTQQYANKVMGNKKSHPAATVKQANFAKNAKKWN